MTLSLPTVLVYFREHLKEMSLVDGELKFGKVTVRFGQTIVDPHYLTVSAPGCGYKTITLPMYGSNIAWAEQAAEYVQTMHGKVNK